MTPPWADDNHKWFRIRQNNSGGYFSHPAVEVYIWAESADAAYDRLMEEAGATNSGSCPCCGSRWSHPWDEDGVQDAAVLELLERCPAGGSYPNMKADVLEFLKHDAVGDEVPDWFVLK